jgi:hypothetical protein
LMSSTSSRVSGAPLPARHETDCRTTPSIKSQNL